MSEKITKTLFHFKNKGKKKNGHTLILKYYKKVIETFLG